MSRFSEEFGPLITIGFRSTSTETLDTEEINYEYIIPIETKTNFEKER